MKATDPFIELAVRASDGVSIGWTWGTTMEHKLWLDAICGREKIWKGKSDERE